MANGCDNWTEWQQLAPEQKDYAVYTLLKEMQSDIKSLKGRKRIDQLYSFLGGLVGGLTAVGGYLILASKFIGG
jgi:hypothetical protein